MFKLRKYSFIETSSNSFHLEKGKVKTQVLPCFVFFSNEMKKVSIFLAQVELELLKHDRRARSSHLQQLTGLSFPPEPILIIEPKQEFLAKGSVSSEPY